MTKNNSKRGMSVLLVALLFAASASVTTASDITGVTGSGGVFNINPAKTVSGIGFREYANFKLDKNNTANLKFDGINKFVNMVDNQININGIVKTVDKNGAFTNGHAVFMSPKGMVVGSDGVLNVGALSVYTPTKPGMNMLKKGVAAGNLTTTYQGKEVDLMEAMGWHGNAPITINGKVFSAGDVTMVANKFDIAEGAGVAAGAVMPADMLFSSLVKTNKDAKVDVRTYARNGASGLNIEGDLVNMGKGNIEVVNRGASGLNVAGNVAASNGALHLVNYTGAMNVAGTVKGAGDNIYLTNASTAGKMTVTGDLTAANGIKVHNKSAKGATLGGNIVNTGKDPNNKGLAITNEAGVLEFKGDVKNTNANMNITNKGSKLVLNNIEASGGKVIISSKGADGMTLNGTIKNSGSTAITNYKGAMTVNGTVQNTTGKMNLTNKGEGALTLAAGSKILSKGDEVLVQNVGAGGFNAKGTVESSAPTFLQNTKGNMTVAGTIKDTDKVLYIGNTGNGALAVNGKVSNTGEVQIYNAGAKGMTINGEVDNKGATYVYNKAGDLNLASTAKLRAEDATLYLANAGKALNIKAGAQVLNKGKGTKLNILNEGAGGLNMDGTVRHSTGQTLITNRAGNMKINGLVDNAGGRLYLNNSGNGALKITQKGELSNGGLGRTYITNKGAGGMDIDGTVAGGGHIVATNRAGGMDISSKVTSTKANVVLTNTGNKNMVVDGTVRGNKVTAFAKGNDIVLGNKATKQIAINGLKKVNITTENGSIKNAGVNTHLIRSGGNLYMAAKNGSIGQDVKTTAVDKTSRDLTKSVNVYVKGRVKAFTTDKNKNSVINIATKGNDLNVDRIKADGKVILLTDKAKDANGKVKTGSILNASTDLDNYANVKGTTVHMISSGAIGTEKKPIHFRQTDATKKSNVVAVKDVNLHARGEASGEDVNFNVIKSKQGSIKANIIRNGVVDNAVAPGKIDITARKVNADLKIKNTSNNPNVIKDYFD